MFEERESEIPEWEQKDEEIPESLKKKWDSEEAGGIRAGVCKDCGWVYTKDDLLCRHCGKPADLTDGVLVSLRRWFFKTWFGMMVLVLILSGIFLYLVR